MARFPKAEAKIAQLARLIAEGLANAPEDFPSPPVSPAELLAQLADFERRNAAHAASRAHTKILRGEKLGSLKTVKDSMRANLRYGEIMARRHPAKLQMLGWGSRRPRTPLKPPGEVRDIEIRNEGDTWLLLGWGAPVDGGAVAAYQVQRRKPGGAWEEVATSTDAVELLREQPRGVELEFRVLALNRAGLGAPSATVTAVL